MGMLIVYQTANINTPSIASGTIAIASNPKRNGWSIQNLGQNALFVNLGGTVSTSIFHYVLKGGTANDDGTGGIVSQMEGVVFTGKIEVTGTSPRYTVSEL